MIKRPVGSLVTNRFRFSVKNVRRTKSGLNARVVRILRRRKLINGISSKIPTLSVGGCV